MTQRSQCVFDIETAALPDVQIPPSLLQKLREPNGDSTDGESWRDRLALFAPAATVVVIGMLNPESQRGQVLYDDRHGAVEHVDVPDGIEVDLIGGDERFLLEQFWKAVANFNRVITYNGRGFDVPFLMQRSLIREVPVSVNLMPPRFHRGTNHLDLLEVLSQFKSVRPLGLATWTEAIGEESPKTGAVAGAEVGRAFQEGRTREIAEYCMRDVVSTARLAERVERMWGPLLQS
jgi:predicted PolB exonuclease-like 3'-5' exonuclease